MKEILDKNSCKVSVFGKKDTISNHIQSSKRYSFGTPFLKIGTVNLPIEYLEDFENMLWYKFFIENKKTLGKEHFAIFKKYQTLNSEKRAKIFSTLVKQQNEIPVVNGDIFEGTQDVVGHQTNCQGVMGSGIAKIVKAKFPSCFDEYKDFCAINEDLLGNYQLCKVGEKKYIANLFGQDKFGTDKCYSDYDALKKALVQMKIDCAGKGLSISLPYNISCGRAGGDWNVVYNILKNVFSDYPVILYKI